MEKVEYRAVIRFLYLNGRTPQQTFNEMKATYGEDAPSYYVVKHWHRQFRCGRKSVETAPIPGRPQSAIDEDTIHQVESAILEDSCITVRQLAQDVKISVGGSFVKSYNTFWAGVATEKVTISLVPQDSGTPTTANTSPSTTTTTTPPTTTTSSPAPVSPAVDTDPAENAGDVVISVVDAPSVAVVENDLIEADDSSLPPAPPLPITSPSTSTIIPSSSDSENDSSPSTERTREIQAPGERNRDKPNCRFGLFNRFKITMTTTAKATTVKATTTLAPRRPVKSPSIVSSLTKE
ncbi:mucin-2-like isoform X1 [Penaeus chinensis]|uniref:mucin-2-like isoform X1 n=1 Tax=Penaeus chinensis TaxID=139456 RepID=UPI001FB6907B|nr:mucin-2-like isoform X1 [Penaeus chinensis]XP_047501886.1 mucin-2-like isoform X1 [Penaeus chinensis]XP_047501887.1 mucin-2-like isoform X1 [Penaeus chinensis]